MNKKRGCATTDVTLTARRLSLSPLCLPEKWVCNQWIQLWILTLAKLLLNCLEPELKFYIKTYAGVLFRRNKSIFDVLVWKLYTQRLNSQLNTTYLKAFIGYSVPVTVLAVMLCMGARQSNKTNLSRIINRTKSTASLAGAATCYNSQ